MKKRKWLLPVIIGGLCLTGAIASGIPLAKAASHVNEVVRLADEGAIAEGQKAVEKHTDDFGFSMLLERALANAEKAANYRQAMQLALCFNDDVHDTLAAFLFKEHGEDVRVGDTVCYGRYEQDGSTENGSERIQWFVLNTENGIKLMSRNVLRGAYAHPYTARGSLPWSESDLCLTLNDEFLRAAFEPEEKKRLLRFEDAEWVTLPTDEEAEQCADSGSRPIAVTLSALLGYEEDLWGDICQSANGGYPRLKEACPSIWTRESFASSVRGLETSPTACAYVSGLCPVIRVGTGDMAKEEPQELSTALWEKEGQKAAAEQFLRDPAAYCAGDTVFFGHMETDENETEALSWLVLDKTQDRLTLISRKALTGMDAESAADWLVTKFPFGAFSDREKQLLPLMGAAVLPDRDMVENAMRYSLLNGRCPMTDTAAALVPPSAADSRFLTTTETCAWWLADRDGTDAYFVNAHSRNEYTEEKADARLVLGVRPVVYVKLNP